MTRFVYDTATSLDGFTADGNGSLAWLVAVGGDEADEADEASWLDGVGALVMGSATFHWLVRELNLGAHPERWTEAHGARPAFVFSTRDLPCVDGADVRAVRGDVRGHADAIGAAAGEGEVRVVGGGDLAGQFLDAGLLNVVAVTIAPVTLGAGRPLLPRFVPASRLELLEARARGRFVRARYAVDGAPSDRAIDAGGTRHLTARIARDPDAVQRFVADPRNLPRWAPGLAADIREDGGRWVAESPLGRVSVRFADANPFGVLDHVVTLPDGTDVLNPMRVMPAEGGAEVVFTLRRGRGDDRAAFERDAATVRRDLERLRELLESEER